ncbi:MAG: hypothetical protein ACTSVY_03075 [Candidatus Helarchaeota archaeon]
MLSQDYHRHAHKIKVLQAAYDLKNKEKEILKIIKENIIKKNASMHLLEAISTVIYLKNIKINISDDEIFISTKKLKPYLSDSIIVIANNIAKEMLFKPEYLTDDLKEEIKTWDNIDD